MTYLSNFIAYLFTAFRRYKKKLFLFLALVLLFFTIRFPYEEGVSFLLNQIKKGTNNAFNLHYDSFSINPIGPTIVFRQPEVYIRAIDTTLKVRQIKLSPSYLSLLTLNLGGKINVLLQNASHLHIVLKQKKIKNSQNGVALDINIPRLDPQALRSIFPQITQWKSGSIQFKMTVELDPSFTAQPEGIWFLEGKNLETRALSFSSFTQNPNTIGIGSFPFPPFKWGKIFSRGSVKDGEIQVSSLHIGEEKDSFQVKLAGLALVPLQRGSYSPMPRGKLESYDFGIEVQATDAIKSKLFFLDLLFGNDAQTKEGHKTKYLARVSGNRSQKFSLTPIQKLPTLEEIISPKQGAGSSPNSNIYSPDGG